MATTTVPVRRRPPLIVEWVYIRYRTLMLIVGAILVLGAFGVAWSKLGRSPITQEQAARAIAAAEQALARAGALDPAAVEVVSAQQHLERAQLHFDHQRFAEAHDEAVTAEQQARLVLSARQSGEAEVRVVRVDGDVRVKRAGQFLWAPASERDPLRSGDQLRTGDNGSAHLLYFDGAMTTVSPSTLLEIRELFRDQTRRTQRVSERLAFGQVSAETQDNDGVESVHEVATDSAAVLARRAAEFRVSHDRDGRRSEVVTARGELTLAAGGREIKLTERTRMSVAAGKVIEQAPLLEAPRLVAPLDQASLTAPREAAAALAWAAVEGAAGYRVQVTERPLFGPVPGSDQRVKGTELTLAPLSAGTYFWRVAAVDERQREGQWSASRKFRIAADAFHDPDDRAPPPLEISEVMIVGANAVVTGRSEPGALVWVEGERVEVGDDGGFTWVVPLRHDGENKIRFVAQDAAGNETRRLATTYLDAP